MKRLARPLSLALLPSLLLLLLLLLPRPASAYDLLVQPELLSRSRGVTNALVHDDTTAYPEETAICAYSLASAATAHRDLWLFAASDATFLGNARQDLRAFAAAFRLAGTVAGNLAAAANGIQLLTNAAVSGDLLLAAGTTILADGHVAGTARFYAPDVRLAGTYDADVYIYATNATIAPGTVIAGTLVWHCPAPPVIPADASIPNVLDRSAAATPRSFLSILLDRLADAALFLVAFLLLGLPFFRLFPLRAAATLTLMQARPFRSILLGLALFMLVPFLALLLVATGYGMPVGLAALLLFALVALLGPVLLAALAGHALFHRRPASIFRILGPGLLLLAALRVLFPGFAATLLLFSAVYGLGAFALSLLRPPPVMRLPGPPPSQPQPQPPPLPRDPAP